MPHTTTLCNWASELKKVTDHRVKLQERLNTFREGARAYFDTKKHTPERLFSEEKYYGWKFREWALEREQQVFAYTGVDIWGNIQRIHGKCARRWSKSRKKRSLALIYSFTEALPKSYDMYFATLTVKHPVKHTFVNQKKAIEDIRAAWQLYRIWLRVRIPYARYLRVIEPGEKNGYGHIHMVIAVPAGEYRAQQITEKWVEKCRKIGNEAQIEGQNLQKCEDIKNVGAYISKYIAKSLETADEHTDSKVYWRWMEIAYRLRLRCVAMDAASREYIKKKYEGFGCGVKGEFMFLETEEAEDTKTTTGEKRNPLLAALLRIGIDPYEEEAKIEQRSERSERSCSIQRIINGERGINGI